MQRPVPFSIEMEEEQTGRGINGKGEEMEGE